MKIAYIETHQYAPELNKVVLQNGTTLDAPSCYTVKDFRKINFPRVRVGRWCKIEYINHDMPELNRTYNGYTDYQGIMVTLKALKKRHNMPNGQFKISIKYIG